MSKENQNKSLIDLAREHMDNAGADPSHGIDIPEQPAASPERLSQEAAQPTKPERVPVQQEASDVFDGTISDAVGDLLANVEADTDWRPVLLPSRGKAYIECEETVNIKPFTYAQERKLRSIKKAAQGIPVIKSLFNDCVKGLDYDSMTLEDKNYLLFKLREISYGDDYALTLECMECNSKNALSMEISKIEVKYAEDDYKEPLEITLPDSKQKVVFVTPRSKDEHYMTDMEVLIDNLWRFMISVGKYSDERIKQEFLKKTTVRDVAYFREQLIKERYGMRKSMSFECAGCGAINESIIPFNESFFSVS